MSGLPYWPSPGLFCFSSIALLRPRVRCPAFQTGLPPGCSVSVASLCSGRGPSAYSSSRSGVRTAISAFTQATSFQLPHFVQATDPGPILRPGPVSGRPCRPSPRLLFVSAASLCSGHRSRAYSSSSFSTAIKASVGSCTLPRLLIFFLFPRKSFFFCGDPFDCTGSGQMNCPCALRRTCAAPLCGAPGKKKMNYSSSSFSTAIKASVGSCTLPRLLIFFLFPAKSFSFVGTFDCTGSGQMNCPCALRRTCAAPLCGAPGKKKMNYSSSSFSTAIKASVGSCTLPKLRIFFLFPHKSFFLLRGPL